MEELDSKSNDLKKDKNDIIAMKNILPSKKLEQMINIQDDAKNVQNLLGQTNQIKQ